MPNKTTVWIDGGRVDLDVNKLSANPKGFAQKFGDARLTVYKNGQTADIQGKELEQRLSQGWSFSNTGSKASGPSRTGRTANAGGTGSGVASGGSGASGTSGASGGGWIKRQFDEQTRRADQMKSDALRSAGAAGPSETGTDWGKLGDPGNFNKTPAGPRMIGMPKENGETYTPQDRVKDVIHGNVPATKQEQRSAAEAVREEDYNNYLYELHGEDWAHANHVPRHFDYSEEDNEKAAQILDEEAKEYNDRKAVSDVAKLMKGDIAALVGDVRGEAREATNKAFETRFSTAPGWTGYIDTWKYESPEALSGKLDERAKYALPGIVAKYQDEIVAAAEERHMDVDQFLGMLSEQLGVDLGNELHEQLVQEAIPKTKVDAFLDAASNNFIGNIVRGAMSTEGEKNIRGEAQSRHMAGEGYQLSTGESIFAGAVAMGTDVVGTAIAFGLPELFIPAKLLTPATIESMSVLNRVFAGSGSSMAKMFTGFGAYGVMNRFASNFSTNQHSTPLEYLTTFATEGATGLLPGATNAVMRNLTRNIGISGMEKTFGEMFWNGVKGAGARIVSLGAEGSAFAMGGYIFNGEEFSVASNIESTTMIAYLKAMGLFGKLIKGNNIFKMSEALRRGDTLAMRFSPDVKLEIKSTYGNDIFAEAKKAFKAAGGKNDRAAMEAMGKELDKLDNLSWDARNAINTAYFGAIATSRPRYERMAEDENAVYTLDKNGRAVSAYYEKNPELRKAWKDNKAKERQQADTREMLHQAVAKEMARIGSMRVDSDEFAEIADNFIGEKMRKGTSIEEIYKGLSNPNSRIAREFQNWLMEQGRVKDAVAELGMTMEDLEHLLTTPLEELNANDLAVLKNVYDKLSKIAYPDSEVHVEQSELEGQMAAEDAGVGTDNPDPEVGKKFHETTVAAEETLARFFKENDEIREDWELLTNSMNEEQAYVVLRQRGYTEEDLAPIVDYLNAAGRERGFNRGAGLKIDEAAEAWGEGVKYLMKPTEGGVVISGMVVVEDGTGKQWYVRAGEYEVEEDGTVSMDNAGLLLVDEQGGVRPWVGRGLKLVESISYDEAVNRRKQMLAEAATPVVEAGEASGSRETGGTGKTESTGKETGKTEGDASGKGDASGSRETGKTGEAGETNPPAPPTPPAQPGGNPPTPPIKENGVKYHSGFVPSDRVRKLEQEAAQLSSQLEDLNKKLDDLRAKRAELTERRKRLRGKRRQDATEELEGVRKEINDLLEQMEPIEEKLDDATEEWREANNKELTEHLKKMSTEELVLTQKKLLEEYGDSEGIFDDPEENAINGILSERDDAPDHSYTYDRLIILADKFRDLETRRRNDEDISDEEFNAIEKQTEELLPKLSNHELNELYSVLRSDKYIDPETGGGLDVWLYNEMEKRQMQHTPRKPKEPIGPTPPATSEEIADATGKNKGRPEGDVSKRFVVGYEGGDGARTVSGGSFMGVATDHRGYSREGTLDSNGERRTEHLQGVDIYDKDVKGTPRGLIVFSHKDYTPGTRGQGGYVFNTWRPLTEAEKARVRELFSDKAKLDEIFKSNNVKEIADALSKEIDKIMSETKEPGKERTASEEDDSIYVDAEGHKWKAIVRNGEVYMRPFERDNDGKDTKRPNVYGEITYEEWKKRNPSVETDMEVVVDDAPGEGAEAGKTEGAQTKTPQEQAEEIEAKKKDKYYRAYTEEQDQVEKQGGLVMNEEAEKKLPPSERGLLHAFGKKVGKKVVVLSDAEMTEMYEKGTNGASDIENNTIYLNSSVPDFTTITYGHEMTHMLKSEKPTLWKAFTEAVDRYYGDGEVDRIAKNKKALYDKHVDKVNEKRREENKKLALQGKPLKTLLKKYEVEDYKEEVYADFAGKNFINNEKAIRKLIEGTKQSNRLEMIKSVIDWINEKVTQLKDTINLGSEMAGTLAQIRELRREKLRQMEEAKKLWEGMYNEVAEKQAEKVRAEKEKEQEKARDVERMVDKEKIPEETARELSEKGLTVDGGSVMSETAQKLKVREDYKTPMERTEEDEVKILFSRGTMSGWKKSFLGSDPTRRMKTIARSIENWYERAAADDATDAYMSYGDYPGGDINPGSKGPLRTNVEYVWTFDIDTSCPRTLQYLNYCDVVEKRIGRMLSQREAIILIETMRAMGQQIPCTYCYAENKRQALKQYFLNFIDTRNKVLKAATDEEAIKLMYGQDKNGELGDAAAAVFAKWRGEDELNGYRPDIKMLNVHYKQARNVVLSDLDMLAGAGKINPKMSDKSITEMLCKRYGIETGKDASQPNKGRRTSISNIVNEWRYDAIEGRAHRDFQEMSRMEDFNKNALALWDEMCKYGKSASSAKNAVKYYPYTDELQRISVEDRDYINGMGGLRMHSTNDFRIDYVGDYFQLIADMDKGGWMGHTYTKNPDFVRIFGRTGYRINMSIAAYDVDGEVIMNQEEGHNWDEVKILRRQFDNAGTMFMTTSHLQLQYALDADWIDMIIPFHASGLPKEVWYDMRRWEDATNVQNEAFYSSKDKKALLIEKGVEVPKNLDAEEMDTFFDKHIKTKKIYDNSSVMKRELKDAGQKIKQGISYEDLKKQYVDYFGHECKEKGTRIRPHFLPGETRKGGNKIPGWYKKGDTPEQSVQRYKDLCAQYGVRPRFQGITVKYNGKDVDITEHPGYIKLIKEASRIDTPQKPVKYNLDKPDAALDEWMAGKNPETGKSWTPMEYAMAKLREFAGQGGYENLKEDQYGVVDDFMRNVIDYEKETGKQRPMDYISPDARMMWNITRRATDAAAAASMTEAEIYGDIPYHPAESSQMGEAEVKMSVRDTERDSYDPLRTAERIAREDREGRSGLDGRTGETGIDALGETSSPREGDVKFALGAPYQGSKNRIAKRIIDRLPKGNRFVDLFSGGGAVTHAAMLSGKYGKYRMNDLDGRGQDLFLQGVRGEWRDYDRTEMTDEEFAKIKGTPEAIPWSHNAYGDNIARIDRNGRDKAKEQIARVKNLESLNGFKDQIEDSKVDYREVELQPGDVVYCDIPYEQTSHSGYGSGKGFNKGEFVEWAQKQDAPVYVSEYTMPKGWTEVDSWEVRDGKGGKRVEKLWVQDKFADRTPDKIHVDEETGIRFSIGGEKGAASNPIAKKNLDAAREMEKGGKDERAIWLATGWEKGKDGKWRHELPDAKPKPFSMSEVKTIADVVDAPELFDAYPQLKDYRVEFRKLKGDDGIVNHGKKLMTLDIKDNTDTQELPDDVREKIQDEARDWFWSGEKKTRKQFNDYLNARLEEASQRILNEKGAHTIIHELQHAIQALEGFARGGSPSEGQKRYNRLAGEVEARNASRRSDMTDRQRSMAPLSETEDVPRDEQIVRFSINPMTEEEASQYKPIGKGDFGDIYDQFKGNAKDAIRLLALKKNGEAIGALNHNKIGDIDLVWGKEGTSKSDGYGLSKILKFHPEVAEDLQSILDSMEIKEWGKNRIRLQNATHEAAVSLDYFGKEKKWLLTAYKKRESSATDKTMNTAGNHNDLQSDTALLQTEDDSVRKDRQNNTNSQENPEKTSEVKLKVSEREDKAYMDAVKKGDEKAASRMVTEAVKRAMPDTKVVDEDGNPLAVYHGTDLDKQNGGAPFYVFKENSHFGTWRQAEDILYGNLMGYPHEPKIYEAFLNITKPKYVEDMPEGVYENPADYWEPIIEQAKKEGYDGIIYENKYEGKGGDSYIAFSPDQIKSAEAITRDDAGEVIPLSERFNSEKEDIRFSVGDSGKDWDVLGRDDSERDALRGGSGRDALYRMKEEFKDGQVMKVETEGSGDDRRWRTDMLGGSYNSPENLLDAFRDKFPETFARLNKDGDIEVVKANWRDAENPMGTARRIDRERKLSQKQEAARKAYVERKTARAKESIGEVSKKLGLDVEIVDDASKLEGKKQKAKGFYDTKTGKITLVLGNHQNLGDLNRTLLHEGVAHHGLRKMLGSGFDRVLDNIYSGATGNVAGRIGKMMDEIAQRDGVDLKKLSQKEMTELRREATEEYLARIAEDMRFNGTDIAWMRIKYRVNELLQKMGIDVRLSDNDLRYLLWRSKNNLEDTADPMGTARRVRMESYWKDEAGTPGGLDALGRLGETGKGEQGGQLDALGGLDALGQGEGRTGQREGLGRTGRTGLDGRTGTDDLDALERGGGRMSAAEREYWDENGGGDASTYGADEVGNSWEDAAAMATPKEEKVLFSLTPNPYDTPDAVSQKMRYEQAAKEYFKEAHVDQYNSLKKAILILTGKKKIDDVMDTHNVYRKAQHYSSVTSIQQEQLERTHVKKLTKSIEKCIKAVRKLKGGSRKEAFEDIKIYTWAKSGLERNRSLRMRDFIEEQREKEVSSYVDLHPEAMPIYRQKVNATNWTGMSRADVDAMKEKLAKEAHAEWVDKEENDYRTLRATLKAELDNGNIRLWEYLRNLDDNIRRLIPDYDPASKDNDRSGLNQLVDGFEKGKWKENDVIDMVMDWEADLGGTEKELWESVNALTGFNIQKQYESGLISKDMKDHILGMMDWYVPMRGFNETMAEDVYAYMTGSDGTAVKLEKKANGRWSMPELNSFAVMTQLANKAILKGEMNKVVQSLLRLVDATSSDDPSKDLFTKSHRWEEKTPSGKWVEVGPNINEGMSANDINAEVQRFNADMEQKKAGGYARRRRGKLDIGYRSRNPRMHNPEHAIDVYVNGELTTLYVNGDPRVAQSLNGLLTNASQESHTKFINRLKRLMMSSLTAWSPNFLASNFFRDLSSARENVLVKHGAKYAFSYNLRYLRNVPDTMRLWYKWRNGTLDESKPREKLFKEFLENGGRTGYIDQKKIDDCKQMLNKALKLDGVSRTRQLADVTLTMMENVNMWAENVARFTAFETSRARGKSLLQSVADAKDVTTNFNAQGAGYGTSRNANNARAKAAGWTAGALRSLYFFVNPGVQTIAMKMRNAQAHPGRFAAAVAARIAWGALWPQMVSLWNQLIGDDETRYEDLPEWDRKANVCYPAGNGRWIKQPIGIEERVGWEIGQMISAHLLGHDELKSGKNPWLDAASIFTALMPVDPLSTGGNNVAVSVMPSALGPIVQALMGVSWTGAPMEKEVPSYQKKFPGPRYKRAFSSTPEYYVGLSKFLSDLTNGDADPDITPGTIDWSPAAMKTLAEGYTGGIGTVIAQIASLASGHVESKNIPVASRIFTQTTDDSKAKNLNQKWWKVKNKLDAVQEELKQYNKKKSNDPMYNSYKINLEREWKKRLKEYEDVTRQIEWHEEQAEAARSENVRASHLRKAEVLKEEFVNRMMKERSSW